MVSITTYDHSQRVCQTGVCYCHFVEAYMNEISKNNSDVRNNVRLPKQNDINLLHDHDINATLSELEINYRILCRGADGG